MIPKFAPGYNPLRWSCDTDGCFNKKKRPKIELFADCFPGLIAFTDVDGWVEINGHYLVLEWKPVPVNLATGQRIAYERLPKQFSVIIVAGDAETMVVTHVAWARNGKVEPWVSASLYDLQCTIFDWAAMHRSPWQCWAAPVTELTRRMIHRFRALSTSIGA